MFELQQFKSKETVAECLVLDMLFQRIEFGPKLIPVGKYLILETKVPILEVEILDEDHYILNRYTQ